MKLLLAVLAATCGIQDENAGRCGSLADRVEACVGASMAIEMVDGRRCDAILELRDDWRAADECRARREHLIFPACEHEETYRTDVVGYKPPRTESERVAACVEVRLEPGDTARHKKNLRGQCQAKIRADDRPMLAAPPKRGGVASECLYQDVSLELRRKCRAASERAQ